MEIRDKAHWRVMGFSVWNRTMRKWVRVPYYPAQVLDDLPTYTYGPDGFKVPLRILYARRNRGTNEKI